MVRDELGRDPLCGEVFVFIGVGRNRLKLLLYESGGYVLWYKRLEMGTLELPKGEGTIKLTAKHRSHIWWNASSVMPSLTRHWCDLPSSLPMPKPCR